MTAITVLKDNVPTGPFTREQVAEKLQAGEMGLDDLAFVEGLSQWTPLREVLAQIDRAGAPAAPAAPAYSYAATMQPPEHLVYGGFWMRFCAYFIDGLILAIPLSVLLMFVGGIAMAMAGAGAAGRGASAYSGSEVHPAMGAALGVGVVLLELFVWASFIIIMWLYFAKLESGPHQATFGKRAVGLKVTDLTGQRLSFGHATGRFFGKMVTGLIPFAIGFIMAAFTEKKQALHDMIAGTLVLKQP